MDGSDRAKIKYRRFDCRLHQFREAGKMLGTEHQAWIFLRIPRLGIAEIPGIVTFCEKMNLQTPYPNLAHRPVFD
jgi:hypothetical protein